MFGIKITITAKLGELSFSSVYMSDRKDWTQDQINSEAFDYAAGCAERWKRHAPSGFDSFSVTVTNRYAKEF